MKKLIFLLSVIFSPTLLSAAEEKTNCDSWKSKLKAECNFIGDMKKFSSKHKTIGQSLGMEEGEEGKKKTLREFSKENKTIDQTIKNIIKK